MDLLKSIKLYYNGKQVEVPFLPYVSMKKMAELESIIPTLSLSASKKEIRIAKEKTEKQQALEVIATEDITEAEKIEKMEKVISEMNSNNDIVANRSLQITLKLLKENSNTDVNELAQLQRFIDIYIYEIRIAYIKAMIHYNAIEDKQLVEQLQTYYDSDFWMEQDVEVLQGAYNFFRDFIAAH